MITASREPMALTEFLAWEERQGSRFEFNGVRPVGGSGSEAA